MVLEISAYIFGILMLIAHFTSDKIHIRHKNMLLSFSAGVSITYMFLHLLPRTFLGEEIIYIFFLTGFVAIRMIEVHIRKNTSFKNYLHKETDIHAAIIFMYHIFIGIVAFDIISEGILQGVLFFFPILLYSMINSVSTKKIHKSRKEGIWRKIVLSSSTLIGITISVFIQLPFIVYDALLGFIIGSMLYIILTDSTPKITEDIPKYFVAGILIYTVLIWIIKII